MIKYSGCLLDNVWLINGYSHGVTESGREFMHIDDVHGLHRAITEWVCGLDRPLTGTEFKLLRVTLDLSQRKLADLLRVSEQTISLWERGSKIDSLADATTRFLVMERNNPNAVLEDLLTKISAHDNAEHWAEEEDRMLFEAMPQWRHAAAA
jgi:DNA-binding transcriptional regulator YiaG